MTFTVIAGISLIAETVIPLYHKVESAKEIIHSVDPSYFEQTRRALLSQYSREGAFPSTLPATYTLDKWGYPFKYEHSIDPNFSRTSRSLVRHMDRNFRTLPSDAIPYVTLTARGPDHLEGTADDVEVVIYPNWQELIEDTATRMRLMEFDLSRLDLSSGKSLSILRAQHPDDFSAYYLKDLNGRDMVWTTPDLDGDGSPDIGASPSYTSAGPDGEAPTESDNIRALPISPLRLQILWLKNYGFRSDHDPDLDLYLRLPFSEKQFADLLPQAELENRIGTTTPSATERWLGSFNPTFPGEFRKMTNSSMGLGQAGGPVLGWHYEIGATPNASTNQPLSQNEAMLSGGGASRINTNVEDDAKQGLLYQGEWLESVMVDSLEKANALSPAGSYELRAGIRNYGIHNEQLFRIQIHTGFKQEHFNLMFTNQANKGVVQKNIHNYVRNIEGDETLNTWKLSQGPWKNEYGNLDFPLRIFQKTSDSLNPQNVEANIREHTSLLYTFDQNLNYSRDLGVMLVNNDVTFEWTPSNGVYQSVFFGAIALEKETMAFPSAKTITEERVNIDKGVNVMRVESSASFHRGPSAHYRFDNQSVGNTALDLTDASGNGRDLKNEVSSTPTRSLDRYRQSNALLFDNNKQLYIPKENVVPLSGGGFTLATWVKFENGHSRSFYHHLENGAEETHFYISSSKPIIRVGQREKVGTALDADQWHFIVVTLTPTPTSLPENNQGTLKMYVNGKQDGGEVTYVDYAQGTSVARSYVGKKISGNSLVMDELMIYAYPLSDEAIETLYLSTGFMRGNILDLRMQPEVSPNQYIEQLHDLSPSRILTKLDIFSGIPLSYTTGRHGEASNAIVFNPTNTDAGWYLLPPMEIDREFTFAAWINPLNSPSDGPLFYTEKGLSGSQGYFSFGQDGHTTRWIASSTQGVCRTASNTLTSGYHHYVVTWKDKRQHVYKDGELLHTCFVRSTIPFHDFDRSFIGGAPDLGNAPFRGVVDDFKLFDRALDTSDVKALYSHPDPYYEVAALYSFDGNNSGNALENKVMPLATTHAFSNLQNPNSARWVQGKRGFIGNYAYRFTGVEKLIAPMISVQSHPLHFTLSVWIKPLAPETNGDIAYRQGNYRLWMSDNKIHAAIGNHCQISSAVGLLTARKWAHLSFVYDPLRVNRVDRMELYLNGDRIANGDCTIPLAQNTDLEFGEGFEGDLDDIYFHYRPLSQSAVRTLYRGQGKEKTISENYVNLEGVCAPNAEVMRTTLIDNWSVVENTNAPVPETLAVDREFIVDNISSTLPNCESVIEITLEDDVDNEFDVVSGNMSLNAGETAHVVIRYRPVPRRTTDYVNGIRQSTARILITTETKIYVYNITGISKIPRFHFSRSLEEDISHVRPFITKMVFRNAFGETRTFDFESVYTIAHAIELASRKVMSWISVAQWYLHGLDKYPLSNLEKDLSREDRANFAINNPTFPPFTDIPEGTLDFLPAAVTIYEKSYRKRDKALKTFWKWSRTEWDVTRIIELFCLKSDHVFYPTSEQNDRDAGAITLRHLDKEYFQSIEMRTETFGVEPFTIKIRTPIVIPAIQGPGNPTLTGPNVNYCHAPFSG